MQITGQVIFVSVVRSGKSERGNEWCSQDFVVKYFLDEDERFERRGMFNLRDADKIQKADLHEGDKVRVKFDLNAREYEGKWFGQNDAWAVEKLFAADYAPQAIAQPQPSNAAPTPQSAPVGNDSPVITEEQQRALNRVEAAFPQEEAKNDLPF